ncbi:hypothetical protein J4423_04915 [Candidatus Pacearchaeota archaeon]|nr:hypothetical protein [Candidatus Pacearchaeota archaeon]
MNECEYPNSGKFRDDAQAFRDSFLLANLMNIYSSKGKDFSESEVFRVFRDGIELIERRLGLKDGVGKRLYSVELERELMKAEENKPYFKVNKFLTNSIGTYSRWRKLPDIPEEVGNTLRAMFNERLAEVSRIARDE